MNSIPELAEVVFLHEPFAEMFSSRVATEKIKFIEKSFNLFPAMLKSKFLVSDQPVIFYGTLRRINAEFHLTEFKVLFLPMSLYYFLKNLDDGSNLPPIR